MLTSEQIDLIRDAFERIAPRREAFAEDFYDRLFSLHLAGEKLELPLAVEHDGDVTAPLIPHTEF